MPGHEIAAVIAEVTPGVPGQFKVLDYRAAQDWFIGLEDDLQDNNQPV